MRELPCSNKEAQQQNTYPHKQPWALLDVGGFKLSHLDDKLIPDRVLLGA